MRPADSPWFPEGGQSDRRLGARLRVTSARRHGN